MNGFEQDAAGPVSMPHTIDHIFALRRSGHHAIIEWLKGCYETNNEVSYHENSVYNRHLRHAQSWPDPAPEMIWQSAEDHDVLLVSYEDVDFDERWNSPAYSALRAPEYGETARSTIVLRDWFNFAASRLRYQANCTAIGKHDGLIFGLDWPEVEERWFKYANLVLNGDPESPSPICINYNRWCVDPGYRSALVQRYGVPNSDSRLDAVPDFGSGSSFEGRAMHGSGSAMNVLRRWEDLSLDLVERYEHLIGNTALGEINMNLFGIDQEAIVSSVQRRLVSRKLTRS
jgi:hypothetical protein